MEQLLKVFMLSTVIWVCSGEKTNLKIMYVQNEHLKPVRNNYCRQRIPNVGKYNWRHVRDDYRSMMAVLCDDMHDVEFTFNSLQASESYDASS